MVYCSGIKPEDSKSFGFSFCYLASELIGLISGASRSLPGQCCWGWVLVSVESWFLFAYRHSALTWPWHLLKLFQLLTSNGRSFRPPPPASVSRSGSCSMVLSVSMRLIWHRIIGLVHFLQRCFLELICHDAVLRTLLSQAADTQKSNWHLLLIIVIIVLLISLHRDCYYCCYYDHYSHYSHYS